MTTTVFPSGLIGYTGFVGGNLNRQCHFDEKYNSGNFREMHGKHFSRLVCAGVAAVKYLANRDPENDWAKIQELCDVLATVQADQFVLISTIDVYPALENLDEDSDCFDRPNHAYGTHRLRFENFCRKQFPNCLIVRLPGLFGPGLKKNVIFDLLHDNCLDVIHPDSSFQYYDLRLLSRDIDRAEKAGLRVINLFTEPIPTRTIVERFFPGKEIGARRGNAGHYDLHTRHADLWGQKGPYCYSDNEVLEQLRSFIAEEQR